MHAFRHSCAHRYVFAAPPLRGVDLCEVTAFLPMVLGGYMLLMMYGGGVLFFNLFPMLLHVQDYIQIHY